MEQAFLELNQRLQQLEEKNYVLNQNQDGTETEASDLISSYMPAHLQHSKMDIGERNAILKKYRKIKHFPKPITDENGFASSGMRSDSLRNILTKQMVQSQRDSLDILRMGINTLILFESQNNQNIPAPLLQFTQDVAKIAADNAQRTAHQQLDLALKLKGLKGSQTLVDNDELDPNQTSIFQRLHVDAISKFNGFKRDLYKNTTSNRGYSNRGGQPFQRGRGGRGRGGYNRRSNRGRGYQGNNYNANYNNSGNGQQRNNTTTTQNSSGNG
jgi:hypothetical protein